jgi:hypothetical protein
MVPYLRLDFGAECSCLESMQIDPPPIGPGDEADVESEGSIIRRKSKSHTPKDALPTIKSEQTNRKSNGAPQVEILDDDENAEDGDEETFAVEKVLSHRIGKKSNVSASFVSFYCMYAYNF